MPRTTLKNIAQAAGLSTTTVSLVLNDKPHHISKKKCQLVKDLAIKMNYRPNRLAVGLIKKQSKNIGLIVPDISNAFFAEMTKGVEDIVRSNKYNLLLCNSNGRNNLELECINMLADSSVDGLIITMSPESFGAKEQLSLNALKSLGLHAVIVDSFNEINQFSTVSIDNFQAACSAVEYLISLGHKRIACITGPIGPKTTENRLNGYKYSLKKHNISYNEAMVFHGDYHYQSGYDAVAVLLANKPTAIFCLNDQMAYGAVKALKKQGLRVPDDISVIGFDNIFFSQMVEVPLSTVSQPIYKLGEKAAQILITELTTKQKTQHLVLEHTLKIRQSTAKINN